MHPLLQRKQWIVPMHPSQLAAVNTEYGKPTAIIFLSRVRISVIELAGVGYMDFAV